MITPSCSDEPLLMLVHGSLPLTERLRTHWHLTQCPTCRVRLNALSQVSEQLSQALHVAGPRRSFRRALPQSAVLAGLVGIILLAGGTLWWQWYHELPRAPAELAESLDEKCEPAPSPPQKTSLNKKPSQR